MERITYQRTLDVHKNGIQFTLQGVETGDNLSRVVEISLMASGDAIDFPLENLLPLMYVTTPNATEPSIIECIIKDNTVIYEILPIVEEGITEMQLKLIETTTEGAKKVLVAPKFAVEVTKSNADDSSAMQKTEFTALETAAAKAKSVYDKRFLRMELTSDCIFKAYYADGTIYETDILKQLFHTGDAILAQSFAKGGTGVRANEDTDNAMYYSNVSKSASLETKDAIENSEELLEEVRLHGVYTAFKVDFESGEVEYVSPAYNFKINVETGDLEAIGEAYTFEDDIGRIVNEWLLAKEFDIENMVSTLDDHTEIISGMRAADAEHTNDIAGLKSLTESHSRNLSELLSTTESQGKDISDIKESVKWETIAEVSANSTFPATVELTFNADFGTLSRYSEVAIVVKQGTTITVNSGACTIGLMKGDSVSNQCFRLSKDTGYSGIVERYFIEDAIIYNGHVVPYQNVSHGYQGITETKKIWTPETTDITQLHIGITGSTTINGTFILKARR